MRFFISFNIWNEGIRIWDKRTLNPIMELLNNEQKMIKGLISCQIKGAKRLC